MGLPLNYKPEVAWRAYARRVVLSEKATEASPAKYSLRVTAIDSHEPGSDTIEPGYFFMSHMGDPYTIFSYDEITHTIIVIDEFRVGKSPTSDKIGIVYKSMGSGLSPYLAPIYYRHLHRTALDNSKKIEQNILWQYINLINSKWHPEGLIFTATDSIIEWTSGKINIHNWDSRVSEAQTNYVENYEFVDTTPVHRIYTFESGSFEFESNALHYIYAFVPIDPEEIIANINIIPSYYREKIYKDRLCILMGIVLSVADGRLVVLDWANTLSIEKVNELIVTNNETIIPEIIQSSVGFSRESWLIEDTSLTEITQLSSWYVIAFNELVGNFKATVMVRDKVTNAIITVQNTFGFDYTNVASEVGDDNAIITDGSISLVLSVDTATDKLKAVVSGMTGNAKRIHFCFERCVLSKREIELAGTADMALGMEGVPDTAMELSGTAEIGIDMEGDLTAEIEETIYPVNFGLLYNWPAVMDSRKISSSDDWYVPIPEDWAELCDYVDDTDSGGGGWPYVGGPLKETGLEHWDEPNLGATNEYNFSAVGSGTRAGLDGSFWDFKFSGSYLSSTSLIILSLVADTEDVIIGPVDYETDGLSLRLVRTATTEELLLSDGTYCTPYIGNNGIQYKTVKIGNQVWLAYNLCETRFRNSDIIAWYGAAPANFFTSAEWAALTTAGCCAYNNTPENVAPGFTFPT